MVCIEYIVSLILVKVTRNNSDLTYFSLENKYFEYGMY